MTCGRVAKIPGAALWHRRTCREGRRSRCAGTASRREVENRHEVVSHSIARRPGTCPPSPFRLASARHVGTSGFLIGGGYSYPCVWPMLGLVEARNIGPRFTGASSIMSGKGSAGDAAIAPPTRCHVGFFEATPLRSASAICRPSSHWSGRRHLIHGGSARCCKWAGPPFSPVTGRPTVCHVW